MASLATSGPPTHQDRSRAAGLVSAAGAVRAWFGRRPVERIGLPLVVAAQGVWLGLLCTRGWFYLDDINFMAQATNRPLGWSYLTSPVNDHLTPGLRLVFWVLADTTRLHYTVTIVMRLVLQAVSTVLLYTLLRGMSDSRRGCLLVTTCYAFNPLLVPATLYLSSAVNQQPAQVLALVALHGVLRRYRGGNRAWLALSGLALLGAACFWEKTAADTAAVLIVFRLGWLTPGNLWQRIVATVRDWVGWVLALGPFAVFIAYFVGRGYGSGARDISPGSAVHLAWFQWAHSLWPAVIGATWRWFAVPDVFAAAAAPGHDAVWFGQIAFLLLLVVGWRRAGWSGVLSWTLPLVAVVLGETLVGLGRYGPLGEFAALDFHYAFDLAIPAAMAVVLSCWPTTSLAVAGRRARAAPAVDLPRPRTPFARFAGIAQVVGCVVVVAAVIAASTVTNLRWTAIWHRNPTHAYVSSVLSSVRRAGPTASLYDTPLAPNVMPYLEPNRYLSNLLADAGVPATFDHNATTSLIIDNRGHADHADFFTASSGSATHNSFCSTLVKGRTPVTVQLRRHVNPNEYFLRLTFFSASSANVRVTVHDPRGALVPVRGDDVLHAAPPTGERLLPLTFGSAASVTFVGQSPQTNICMSQVSVGAPLPRS